MDDYAHIVHNQSIFIQTVDIQSLWTAANSTNSGPLGRPLALVSFALNYYATGINPLYYKLTNLIIHLLTGIGIFFLIRGISVRLIDPSAANTLAILTTCLWLTHPLNVSTVLYVVQRMTGMAALLTVWGMVAYCYGREYLLRNNQSGWIWILIGFIAGCIGLLSKETAVLMLGYLLIIEWLVFHFQMPSKLQCHALQVFYVFIIGIPLIWVITTHLLVPGWIEASYAKRSFTLEERLLTEARVLWDYLNLIWLPNIQSMGLYHDGYLVSRSLFEPISTFFAIAAHILVIGLAFALRNRFPLLLFAVAWFYIGHSAESSFLSLEIKYEHRNYLPMLGMLLLLIHSIFFSTTNLKNIRVVRKVILFVLILTFSGGTFVRSSHFGNFWGFAEMEAEHHPESSRANQNAAVSIMKLMIETKRSTPELISKATEYLLRSAQTNPSSTAPLFTLVLFLPEITHQPVRDEFVTQLSSRLRNALPDANINVYFTAILRLAEDRKLLLSSTQVETIFENTEANTLIQNGTKADIIATRAAYAQSVEHDNEKALRLIDRALKTDSARSGIYVPAVWIYQEAGMWEDAAEMLEKLKKLDVHGIERDSIKWLTQRQIKHS